MQDTRRANGDIAPPPHPPEGPLAGLWPAIIMLITAAFIALAPSDNMARLEALAVVVGASVGFLVGGYRISLNGNWLVPLYGVESDDWSTAKRAEKLHEGAYLGLVSAFIALYALFYWYAARGFAQSVQASASEPPIPFAIALVTAMTVGALAACSARYAAYIRSATCLSVLVDSEHTDEKALRRVRVAVFRSEQLFEPPGNVFITLGIMATFLGLALGLVTLDLGQFLVQRPNTGVAMSSLKSFIGCMGLALGVSMLGVATALAAQWLRGYGPAVATEDLLETSRVRLARQWPSQRTGAATKRNGSRGPRHGRIGPKSDVQRIPARESGGGGGGVESQEAAGDTIAQPAEVAPDADPTGPGVSLDKLEEPGA